MDHSSVGQEMKLQEPSVAEESTDVDSPPSLKEEHSNSSSCSVVSSAYGDLSSGLREKMSTTRKDSAGDVMNLLAASGQAPAQQRPAPPLTDSQVAATAKAGAAVSVDGFESSHGTTAVEGAGEVAAVNGTGGLAGTSAEDASGSTSTDEDNEEEEEEEEGAPQALQTCVECEDQRAELTCLSCEEPFCRPCWGSLHRRGKRAEHVTQAILGEVMPAPTAESEPPAPRVEADRGAKVAKESSDAEDQDSVESGIDGDEDVDEDEACEDGQGSGAEAVPDGVGKPGAKRRVKRKSSLGLAVGLQESSVLEECRFIPLRLDGRERGLLAMLKGALNVSEYTDRVDVLSSRWSSKTKTINRELHLVLAALAGMMVAGDAKWGRKNAALLDKLEDNQEVFAEIFEVGRRYKITNPEKFRSFYGKMMYMLQDVQAQGRVGLNLVKDIQMVYDFVEEKQGLDLLRDKRVIAATADIAGIAMSKSEVQRQVAAKSEARAGLLRDFVSPSLSREDVERALDSIADANNYIAFNVAPVERVLDLLRNNFHPDKPDGEWSLKLGGGGGGGRKRFSSPSMYNYGYGSLSSGYGGSVSSMFGSSTAQLSHDHRTQFVFVTQSLRLWSEAMRNMYRLWYFADLDLLSGKASYRLCNTGQGLNRVQSCPSVSVEMRRILRIVQSACGPWVGLSVVHLGDRDVPNALVFIDKYTQIPRILNPIAEVVRSLEEMALDPVIGDYVEDGWGGVHNAKMAVLSDFFKGGFDGSGDDGGSCIDGRLTSAWNWCSLLPKKAFAPIFYLAGQYGFDGGWSSGLGD